MKLLLAVLVLVVSVNCIADDSKHQIIIGNDSFGWSGTGSSAETDKDLGIKDFDMTEGNLNLNYAYRFGTNFQLGLVLGGVNENNEIKYADGTKQKSEDNDSLFYIFGTWNFAENFKEAWYLTLAYGNETYKSKTKDETGTIADVEYDVSSWIIAVGKRFSLSKLGIENLTYSPTISFHQGKVGGDLEDAGVESISQVTLDIIKLDLLF